MNKKTCFYNDCCCELCERDLMILITEKEMDDEAKYQEAMKYEYIRKEDEV